MSFSISSTGPFMHTCTIYDSIQDVPPDVWRCLVTEVDFAMDRRLVTLQQRTLREQSRMWVVVVRDGANEPAAMACLARFDLEIVNLRGWLRMGVGAARQLFAEQHVERQNVFKEGKKEA